MHSLKINDFIFTKYPSGYYLSQLIAYHPAQSWRDQEEGKDYCTVKDANGVVHEKVKLSDLITKDDERIGTCKVSLSFFLSPITLVKYIMLAWQIRVCGVPWPRVQE